MSDERKDFDRGNELDMRKDEFWHLTSVAPLTIADGLARIVRWRVVLSVCITFGLTTIALAYPPDAPRTREVWSPNKQFVALIDPHDKMATIYRSDKDGSRAYVWKMKIEGWLPVLSLANDGEHLILGYRDGAVLPLTVTKDVPMVRFFKRLSLMKKLTLGDLIQDVSKLEQTYVTSVPRYQWGAYCGFDKEGHYVVETIEGRRLTYDVSTGELVSMNTSPAKALTVAAATAEAWLALLDKGKYAESWDTAEPSLKKKQSKEDFEMLVRFERQLWGKPTSRKTVAKSCWNYLPCVFMTSFENGTAAVEQVQMGEQGGKWRVSAYWIVEVPAEKNPPRRP
ncbi:MAG: DUF4019 domain-containing protein [Thermoguttaceae bacterium]